MIIIKANKQIPTENPFIDLKQLFISFKQLAPEIANEGILICDELLNGSNFIKVNQLHGICNKFITNFPPSLANGVTSIFDVLSYIEITAMSNTNNESHKLQLMLNVMNNCLDLTELYIQLGQPREAFEYLIYSMGPRMGHQAQIPVPIWEMAMQNNIPSTRKTIMRFASNQFQLTSILGLPSNDAFTLYDIIKKWIKYGEDATKEDINCISQFAIILGHLRSHTDISKMILTKLKLQFDIEKNRTPAIAIMIADIFMSIFGEVHNEPKLKWAKEALKIQDINDYPERKMLFSLTILLEDDEFKGEEIKDCLKDFLDYLYKKTLYKIQFNFQRQRFSHFYTLSMRKAILSGEYKYALDFAYLWRTYENSNSYVRNTNDEAILLSIHNLSLDKHKDNMIYLLEDGDEVKYFQYETKTSLKALMKSKDEFEGTWNVLTHDIENVKIKPVDAEVNMSKSDAYYKNLTDYYFPHEIAKELNKIEGNKKIKVLDSTWANTPLPALISQYLEGEISILVEGEQGIDSKIKKALIWCDPDFNLFDAHLEKDAIESILTSHGIECDVFACEQCTKEEFIKRYSSNEYDLIWLMCHGNFDFNIPSNSSLNVGSNEYVNLNQLINIIPVRDKKRMLILNACQSGCSSIRYNAMGFVGLGPGLTNKYQSVVGHLWPVDSFAAGVWAALFANELAGGNSWDLSLNKSIRIMSGGLEEIQKNMNDISHLSIANSLSRRNFEWNKMGYWSSPVIFR
ncbi:MULTISPECIES: CHAT domain-containing protein [Bacillus]|nr:MULTISPECIES: CHAT domain-containing protein [Bacillus]EJV74674.1 hypothetical protein IGE_05471 [Bacillus cereus HuB1-1]MDE7552294.1 CHAT domain-containing protein [Bacillus tropicus]MDE7573769.1 CHAT domain-containing protein [Bacillus tropicus]MED3621011.1 CHAT domain-containing protein [Bacillus thuringiensis]PEW80981.1 CHAT domain-containing protein [Bacillus thuringiensis]